MAAHAGVRWEPADSGWWVEGLVTIMDRQERLSSSDVGDTQRIPPGGTPGFTIYTLRGGYRFNEHVAATAMLENIGDHDYRWHGSGSNEPGINAILGIEATY
jgi:hemoglobin/transferrin/lactoferrin receptor protein